MPTPLVHTRLRPPSSLIGPGGDVDALARSSALWEEYGERIESESARELLAARLADPDPAEEASPEEPAPDGAKGKDRARGGAKARGVSAAQKLRRPAAERPAEAASAASKGAEAVGGFCCSSQGKKISSSVGRGILGMLKR